MDLIIGSHVSFSKDRQLLGSTMEAISYGSNTFMLYTGAPQNSNRQKIDHQLTLNAYKLMSDNNIDIRNIIAHAPYIINLANRNTFDFSISFLKQEIDRCEELGITMLVIHPGSHVGQGIEEGIKNIVNCLNSVIDPNQDVYICLESMSGKGSEIGSNFEEIKSIIDGVKYNNKLKVCLDTCHLNDSGYDIGDIDRILDDFNRIIGLNMLACIHINDSKNEKGISKDRHANFGFGTIGFDKLIKVIYHPLLSGIPMILETPYIAEDGSENKVYAPYKWEIKMIKDKKFDQDFYKNVRGH